MRGTYRVVNTLARCTPITDWQLLSEELQLILSREALYTAAMKIAAQAELLAEEIDIGTLKDMGGAEALRLLAGVLRNTTPRAPGVYGTA